MSLGSSLNVCSITKSSDKVKVSWLSSWSFYTLDGHSNCELLLVFFFFYAVSSGINLVSKYTNSDLIPFGEVLCFGRWQNFLQSGLQMLGCEACLAVTLGKWAGGICEACCAAMQYLGERNHEHCVVCPDLAQSSIKHLSLAFPPVLKQQDFSWWSCWPSGERVWKNFTGTNYFPD